jgi:hypothetical protein
MRLPLDGENPFLCIYIVSSEAGNRLLGVWKGGVRKGFASVLCSRIVFWNRSRNLE